MTDDKIAELEARVARLERIHARELAALAADDARAERAKRFAEWRAMGPRMAAAVISADEAHAYSAILDYDERVQWLAAMSPERAAPILAASPHLGLPVMFARDPRTLPGYYKIRLRNPDAIWARDMLVLNQRNAKRARKLGLPVEPRLSNGESVQVYLAGGLSAGGWFVLTADQFDFVKSIDRDFATRLESGNVIAESLSHDERIAYAASRGEHVELDPEPEIDEDALAKQRESERWAAVAARPTGVGG